jgi:hypothetical protein
MRSKIGFAIVVFAGMTCLAQDTVLSDLPPVAVVKGVPFSAQVVTESTQWLADGNRIIRKSTASVSRDSEGRTRRDQGPSDAGPRVVFIQDAKAGFQYVLDGRSRSARKIEFREVDRSSAPGNGSIQDDSLGTQVIEGLFAVGKRQARTVPAGQTGNAQPIAMVLETWYAPDLQTIILSKYTDPRLGEVVYRLTGIQRGEPDYTLFQVPSGYTVKEEPIQKVTTPENIR